MNPVQKLNGQLAHLSGAIQAAGTSAANVAATLRAIMDLGERLRDTGVTDVDLKACMHTMYLMSEVAEKFNVSMENLLKEFQNVADK